MSSAHGRKSYAAALDQSHSTLRHPHEHSQLRRQDLRRRRTGSRTGPSRSASDAGRTMRQGRESTGRSAARAGVSLGRPPPSRNPSSSGRTRPPRRSRSSSRRDRVQEDVWSHQSQALPIAALPTTVTVVRPPTSAMQAAIRTPLPHSAAHVPQLAAMAVPQRSALEKQSHDISALHPPKAEEGLDASSSALILCSMTRTLPRFFVSWKAGLSLTMEAAVRSPGMN